MSDGPKTKKSWHKDQSFWMSENAKEKIITHIYIQEYTESNSTQISYITIALDFPK